MQALLIVDVQQDFCPGGKLAVANGGDVVPVINALMKHFAVVVMTQDWHPEGHQSFASSHPGCLPFETIAMDYGKQVLWPDHCVQGTSGASFHEDLQTNAATIIIRKGYHPRIDSYSAFFENDGKTKTGLAGLAQELGITEFVVTGLATDFCIKWTVLDGLRLGFGMTVVEDAVLGIDLDGSVQLAWDEMLQAGAGRACSTDFALP